MQEFFGKMREGISDKAKEATIRSKEALDSREIEGKLGELGKKKEVAIAGLGLAAHTMLVGNALDQAALSSLSAAIAAIEAEEKAAQQELADLHSDADKKVAELED